MRDKSSNRAEEPDDVGQLVRFAGVRDQVDMDRFEKAQKRVAEHWQSVVDERKMTLRAQHRKRVVWRFAAAASAIALLTTGYWSQVANQTHEAVQFATVSKVFGDVYLGDSPLAIGDEISVSSQIRTGQSERLVLELESGHIVKIDETSTIVASEQNELRMSNGAVFVQTQAGLKHSALSIVTPMGTATDVGTQFVVRLDGDSIKVAVREGLVNLANNIYQKLEISDGELLTLKLDGGYDVQPVSFEDMVWAWADSMPQTFDIEGAKLSGYLAWYASQVGGVLVWQDERSRMLAESITLSGSLKGTTLKEGLEEVRKIAPFEMEVSEKTIRVVVR